MTDDEGRTRVYAKLRVTPSWWPDDAGAAQLVAAVAGALNPVAPSALAKFKVSEVTATRKNLVVQVRIDHLLSPAALDQVEDMAQQITSLLERLVPFP